MINSQFTDFRLLNSEAIYEKENVSVDIKNILFTHELIGTSFLL